MNTWVLLAETWVFIKGLPKRKDLLFWLILFPLVLMFLINFIFAPREQFISFKVGVIDEDEGSLSRTIINVMNETGVLNPVVIKDGGDLRELLRRGEYPLIIVIPRGFSDNITLATQAQIEVYYLEGSRDSLVALRVFEGFVAGFKDNVSNIAASVFVNSVPEPFRGIVSGYIMFIANPLTLKPHVIETEIPAVKAFKISLVTSIIGISLLFTGILSGLYTVVEKRYEGYVQTLLSSPTRAHEFLLSEVLAVLVGALISVTAIVAGGLMLGAPLHEIPLYKLFTSLVLLFVSTLGLIGLGMVLAVFTKTPQSAGALGNAIAFPIMFLGGLAIPKWMLPSWLQVLPDLLPHPRLVHSITYYILGGWSLEETLVHSLPAITLSLTLLLLGALAYRRVLERIYESP